ncbi:hypothetical protein [Maribacter aquivivus]|uniref:hypothetical protein n=1 Tax=Maribacter aquivivus TaxID=228958 RepID=UPI00249165FB|nr:hypothetical protein [Maribacter aquivivus]
MTKIYFKKENLLIWYFLLATGIGLLIFGWLLIEYFAWQALLLFGIAISKIISISKKPITPVIELNDEGITLLGLNDQPFYPFVNINKIHLDSRALNGYIKLKNPDKKIILDSVAISVKDQKEITAFINQRI